MDRLKKVIKGFECCEREICNCNQCPYAKHDVTDCYHILRRDALKLLKEQQEQKEKWIRDIDLYIADAEGEAKNPVRCGKGYAVGLSYGLNIAKEIIEGKRNHG